MQQQCSSIWEDTSHNWEGNKDNQTYTCTSLLHKEWVVMCWRSITTCAALILLRQPPLDAYDWYCPRCAQADDVTALQQEYNMLAHPSADTLELMPPVSHTNTYMLAPPRPSATTRWKQLGITANSYPAAKCRWSEYKCVCKNTSK